MSKLFTRREFVKSTALVSAAASFSLPTASAESTSQATPVGRIGNQEFSRLMLGGNLIAGWAHSRDLPYVSTLMRRYNTPTKIRQTLEIAESSGITAINSWVMDDNSQIFDHWKSGGKMKWFAQARVDAGGGFSQ